MTKTEIVENLYKNKTLVLETCKSLPDDSFFTQKGSKWSNAGHIEHLINSIKPLNLLLILPKFLLKAITGTPTRPSRTYDELVKKYLGKLETLNPSNNRFGPKSKGNISKEKLLINFEKEYDKLAKNLEKKWNEESFENYLIPHPLLGKLTVREMMMFTVYHTIHHQKVLI